VSLTRTFQFEDFRAARALLTAWVSWRRKPATIRISISRYNRFDWPLVTHDEGGLTSKDFDLASESQVGAAATGFVQ